MDQMKYGERMQMVRCSRVDVTPVEVECWSYWLKLRIRSKQKSLYRGGDKLVPNGMKASETTPRWVAPFQQSFLCLVLDYNSGPRSTETRNFCKTHQASSNLILNNRLSPMGTSHIFTGATLHSRMINFVTHMHEVYKTRLKKQPQWVGNMQEEWFHRGHKQLSRWDWASSLASCVEEVLGVQKSDNLLIDSRY